MIEVSETKAYSIQGINVNGKDMVSIRQMYRTSKNPEWKPGRQGITIEVQNVVSIVKEIRKVVEAGEYETVSFKD